MRRRGLRLPMLSVRALLITCGAMLAVCVGVGLAMRWSLSDYSADAKALDELPYVLNSRAQADRLRPASPEEVSEAIEEATAQGFSVDETNAAYVLGVVPEDVAASAPLVVTGAFTGERPYVYQAFQSRVEVTSVLKGEGVSAGDTIVVYDAYQITEPRNFTGTGQFGDVREVWPVAGGACSFGLTPMREGQEYLFFLVPKEYPSEKDPATYEQTYCLVANPYARISLDIAEHPERAGVFPDVEGPDWERIPFAEACGYDIVVRDEAGREVYLSNCAKVLEETLGEG